MAFTATEEIRVKALEDAVVAIQTAISNLASKEQLRQLTLIKQADIDDLKVQVEELETAIAIIQGG